MKWKPFRQGEICAKVEALTPPIKLKMARPQTDHRVM